MATIGSTSAMKGKIAILIRGLHYYMNYQSPLAHIGLKNIDYRESYQSFIENIYEPLREQSVDIYISTYHSEIEEQLNKDFSPITGIYYDFPGIINDHVIRNYEIAKVIGGGLDLMKDGYDWYVITRFDLLYLMKITEFPVLDNCVNLTHHNTSNNVDDNIHIFDKTHFIKFRKAISAICNKGYSACYKYNTKSKNPVHLLHCMNFFLRYANNWKCDINYLEPEGIYSPHTSPFYRINCKVIDTSSESIKQLRKMKGFVKGTPPPEKS